MVVQSLSGLTGQDLPEVLLLICLKGSMRDGLTHSPVRCSLCSSVLQELLYLSIVGIQLRLSVPEENAQQQIFELTLSRIQLDNQMKQADFKVILAPTARQTDNTGLDRHADGGAGGSTRHVTLICQPFF